MQTGLVVQTGGLNNCSRLGQISNIEFRCSWILFYPAADWASFGLDEFNGMAPKIMLGWKGCHKG